MQVKIQDPVMKEKFLRQLRKVSTQESNVFPNISNEHIYADIKNMT